MLKNVIDLGREASCASTLAQALEAIDRATAPQQALGFGRALLSGQAERADCPVSSIVLLRSGTLALAGAEGVSLTLGGGDAATLPSGPLSWSAEAADCVILLLRGDNPQVELARIDLDHPMSAGGAPNPALLTTPPPRTSRHAFHDEGALSWGIWATTPYARRPNTYSYSEVMMLRKGEVVLSAPEGEDVTFRAGDIFIVRASATVAWSNPSDLEKFWLIRTEG